LTARGDVVGVKCSLFRERPKAEKKHWSSAFVPRERSVGRRRKFVCMRVRISTHLTCADESSSEPQEGCEQVAFAACFDSIKSVATALGLAPTAYSS